MQAFMDTLKIDTPPAEFCYFPKHKNGNLESLNRHLIGQPTASKGNLFHFNKSFYVDDSAFLYENKEDLEVAAKTILDHFKKFGLTMHVGDQKSKSKSEAMFFPTSIKETIKQRKEKTTPSNINLPNEKCIHFTEQFKYLGSLISLELNEDAEIASRINKAKSIMGFLRHFFNCRDVDLRTKYNIYVSCPLNALLWGCETWNLSAKNLKKLEAFHHGAARRILSIKWQQVREEKIRNKQVRFRFCNVPKAELSSYAKQQNT
jgi:hypothetical protein